MIVEEGPDTNGDIPKSDRVIWAVILASKASASSGATSQEGGSGSEAAALSDQFAGKVGPMLSEWSPELFARMTSEF
jgi:hypothetical protein